MSHGSKGGNLNGINNYFEIVVPVDILLFPDLESVINYLSENIMVEYIIVLHVYI